VKHSGASGQEFKTCSKCGKDKPTTGADAAFARAKRSSDGFAPWCRACKAQWARIARARRSRIAVHLAAIDRRIARIDRNARKEAAKHIGRR
jgi:hypothetical protein